MFKRITQEIDLKIVDKTLKEVKDKIFIFRFRNMLNQFINIEGGIVKLNIINDDRVFFEKKGQILNNTASFTLSMDDLYCKYNKLWIEFYIIKNSTTIRIPSDTVTKIPISSILIANQKDEEPIVEKESMEITVDNSTVEGSSTYLSNNKGEIKNKIDNLQKRSEGFLPVKDYEHLKIVLEQREDWRGAIQQAVFDSINHNKTVLLPPDTLQISGPIIIPNRGKICGFGKLISILETTGEFPAIIVGGNQHNRAYNWEISNLTINGGSLGITGIELNYAREGSISNVNISYFQKGITLDQSWSNNIIDCKITENTNKNLELGDQSNDFLAINCQFDKAGNYGIHLLGDSQTLSFIGCVVQKCGKEAILLDGGRSINIIGCYFEQNNSTITKESSILTARGQSSLILGLNIIGSQFWDENSKYSISLDRVKGVSINGSNFGIISDGETEYTISTTKNTSNVIVISSYKEKPFNDIGDCITSIASEDTTSFRNNIQMRKKNAVFAINSMEDTEGSLRMLILDKLYSELRQEVNGDLRLRHLNSGTGLLEEIFRVPATNAWLQIYKNLNMNNNHLQYISSLLMSPSSSTNIMNNSLFIDHKDNKLKFKDSKGKIIDLI